MTKTMLKQAKAANAIELQSGTERSPEDCPALTLCVHPAGGGEKN